MAAFLNVFPFVFYGFLAAGCLIIYAKSSHGVAPKGRDQVSHEPQKDEAAAQKQRRQVDALRGDMMLRLVATPSEIDDMADEILAKHPQAMAMRDTSIYKGKFPSYAVAIPDGGLGFDIRLIDFDPRNELADLERAIMEAAVEGQRSDVIAVKVGALPQVAKRL